MIQQVKRYLNTQGEAAPLAVFRVSFGLLMLASLIRFWSYGWIEKFYISPSFHFTFYGFEWVRPFGNYTYLLFAICAFSTIMITLGYKYRLAITLFFLSFTYIELMDKTMYLNHYYFISMLSFLMIFIPAGSYFSIDALQLSRKRTTTPIQFVPRWTIDSIKLLLGIVYVYAGLAKLNSDWLLEAMPLKIWLPSKFDIPLIGDLLGQEWVQHVFSWFGAGYDLFIPFLLLWRKSRPFAFIMVIIFHVLTRVLFPIGMFPYVMIVSALIFFDAGFHKRIIYAFAKAVKYPQQLLETTQHYTFRNSNLAKVSVIIVAMFFAIQLLLPWRYLAYPGELFWTEEGYRFSWRVMLMEKSGYAQFKIVDGVSGKRFYADNTDFLTPLQEKQMSFQPDFILEYAHYLRDHFESQGHQEVEVYVESYVALNGRLSTTYIDPKVDLAQIEDSFAHKNWIIPFTDEIKGL
ncbi:HTTM domain-containing protein [Dokdonia sp. Hel_I_53]|uniref:HTTM domain-containing protein n=1 Tax=Dokdonia sp. Hel_I_53 TaxID=1566287 RepID=UPI00119BAAAA|nr:HTTM domain-containing protein [Dokdonia sp. Hel_I_53]TVZ51774.1 vitamin K-dependent gamma-carboxylase-like protein [Dokdonia sp. Hel_I_53]